MTIELGQKISFQPSGFGNKGEFSNGMTIPCTVTGRVVWIHPEERFYLVEAEVNGCILRECFPIVRSRFVEKTRTGKYGYGW